MALGLACRRRRAHIGFFAGREPERLLATAGRNVSSDLNQGKRAPSLKLKASHRSLERVLLDRDLDTSSIGEVSVDSGDVAREAPIADGGRHDSRFTRHAHSGNSRIVLRTACQLPDGLSDVDEAIRQTFVAELRQPGWIVEALDGVEFAAGRLSTTACDKPLHLMEGITFLDV
jgi:hypothetical protein